MGSIQITLLIAGLMILGYMGATFYRTNTSQSEEVYFNGAIVSAAGMAESMLEQIAMRSFDEATKDTAVVNPTKLTTSVALGPEIGETYATYDDMDDFNNLNRLDTLSVYGPFRTRVKVRYVGSMNPGTTSLLATFSKRVDVSVTNYFLGSDTIKMTHIYTY